MNLNEFFDYKNRIMEDLCSSPEIVKILTEEENPSVPDVSLPYSQVFPFEFIPETVDSAHTFICFDTDIINVLNKTFYEPALYVWIFTHKSKLRMRNGEGILPDKLSYEVDRILNGNRKYGMGTLDLDSVHRFSPIQDYQGRVLVYSARDWNRPGVNKPVPAKRG